jgi:hypothetical protein
MQGYQSGAYPSIREIEQVLNYSFKKKNYEKNNINSVIYYSISIVSIWWPYETQIEIPKNPTKVMQIFIQQCNKKFSWSSTRH